MKPLTMRELDALLRLLSRLTATSASETIKRVSNSLFTLLTRERYDTIEF